MTTDITKASEIKAWMYSRDMLMAIDSAKRDRQTSAQTLASLACRTVTECPKLMASLHKTATRVSVASCVLECVQLGLEPSGSAGLAYLVPFYNKDKKAEICTLIIGYRGMIQLALRSDKVVSVMAENVYEGEVWQFDNARPEDMVHVALPPKKRGEWIGSWARACLVKGAPVVKFMWADEIEAIRNKSKSWQNEKSRPYCPWFLYKGEMQRKTAVRNLGKYLPSSPTVQRAISIDELADAGLDQQLNAARGLRLEGPTRAEIEQDIIDEQTPGKATAAETDPGDGSYDPDAPSGDRDTNG